MTGEAASPRADAERPDGARSVGQDIAAGNGRWTFGGTVANTFESHIERSVPGYREGHDLVTRISDWFLYDGARALEIGCSTGALLRRMAGWHEGRDVRFAGIEIEQAMADAARKECAEHANVEIELGDALEADLGRCDFIVSYYTMQFVRPARRQELFARIHDALNWGGAFVMFEKVRAPDARFQDIAAALYADHKLSQGFSEAEIVNKSRSLKGVLEPFSTEGNLGLMRRAGFTDVMTVYKNVCFEGFLAIK